MDPKRWRQIEQLYHWVLEREPDHRDAYLRAVCGGDDELRTEVECLIAQSNSTDGLIEPVWEAAADLMNIPNALTPGTRLGPYEILGPLGEAGMGTVYRALDTKLKRSVAIKLISCDLADVAARRRFQREARMASSLNHPHILTVHDKGEFGGRQYLVTEFVDGGTLKDWAKAEKRTWRETVELLK